MNLGVPQRRVRSLSDNQLAITTNNGAESCVKQTRNDGGNVVGAVGPVLKFMLQQVENESSSSWQANVFCKNPALVKDFL